MEWLENTREFQERIESASASTGARSVPMTIALQRIQQCLDKRLDLSKLGLTELPPLPDDLIVLRCDVNELTFLPTLPSSLRVLHCHQNQLSSLPELPPFLESLSCSHNHISCLPALPSSLTQLVCMRNHLTALPPLPSTLQELCIDNNDITQLPTLTSLLALTSLSCCKNLLTSLPSLPHGLHSLFCFANPLETFPELPPTLVYLVCTLPHTKERYAPLRLTPEQIQQVNRENQEWAEAQSMERCIKRCSVYYEELMHDRWNPDRVFQLRNRGYNPSDI
jgi:hypothetical protein